MRFEVQAVPRAEAPHESAPIPGDADAPDVGGRPRRSAGRGARWPVTTTAAAGSEPAGRPDARPDARALVLSVLHAVQREGRSTVAALDRALRPLPSGPERVRHRRRVRHAALAADARRGARARLPDPDALPERVRDALRAGTYERLVRGTPDHAAVHAWVEAVKRGGGPGARLSGLVNAVLRRVDLADAGAVGWRPAPPVAGRRRRTGRRTPRSPPPTRATAPPSACRRPCGATCTPRSAPAPPPPPARCSGRSPCGSPPTPTTRPSACAPRAPRCGPGRSPAAGRCAPGARSASSRPSAAGRPAAEPRLGRGGRGAGRRRRPDRPRRRLRPRRQGGATGGGRRAGDRRRTRPRRAEAGRRNLAGSGLAPSTSSPTPRSARRVPLVDAALLDAPCTGTGTLRGHPEIKLRWRPRTRPPPPPARRPCCGTVAARVRPGGRLLYAVCALGLEEGPGRRRRTSSPGARTGARSCAVAAAAAVAAPVGHWLLPDASGLDGFYLALLERAAVPGGPGSGHGRPRRCRSRTGSTSCPGASTRCSWSTGAAPWRSTAARGDGAGGCAGRSRRWGSSCVALLTTHAHADHFGGHAACCGSGGCRCRPAARGGAHARAAPRADLPRPRRRPPPELLGPGSKPRRRPSTGTRVPGAGARRLPLVIHDVSGSRPPPGRDRGRRRPGGRRRGLRGRGARAYPIPFGQDAAGQRGRRRRVGDHPARLAVPGHGEPRRARGPGRGDARRAGAGARAVLDAVAAAARRPVDGGHEVLARVAATLGVADPDLPRWHLNHTTVQAHLGALRAGGPASAVRAARTTGCCGTGRRDAGRRSPRQRLDAAQRRRVRGGHGQRPPAPHRRHVGPGRRRHVPGRGHRRRERAAWPFDPRSIDAVVLTHGHLDHVGRLPKLVADGYRGPVYATGATLAVAEVVLRDAARILAEDARGPAAQGSRSGRDPERRPLYDEADVDARWPWRGPSRSASGSRSARRALRLGRAGTCSAPPGWPSTGPGGRVVASGDLGDADGALHPPPEPAAPRRRPPDREHLRDRRHRDAAATAAEFAAVVARTLAAAATCSSHLRPRADPGGAPHPAARWSGAAPCRRRGSCSTRRWGAA
jgi:glyoxylase-like metal-dependent hydrolase (beta-lactamase superfamily II)